MIEQIQYELDKHQLISEIIIKAFKKITEQKKGRVMVGKVQDVILNVLELEKTASNRRLIDAAIRSVGVKRYINTGKSYYKNIAVKEAYGT